MLGAPNNFSGSAHHKRAPAPSTGGAAVVGMNLNATSEFCHPCKGRVLGQHAVALTVKLPAARDVPWASMQSLQAAGSVYVSCLLTPPGHVWCEMTLSEGTQAKVAAPSATFDAGVALYSSRWGDSSSTSSPATL
jgi:hypothetical protein